VEGRDVIYYGLILFFVFEYVRPGSFIPGLNVLRLNTLIPLIVVIGTLIQKRGGAPGVMSEWSSRILFFILGMITLSVLTAEVRMYAFEVFTTVLGYVLIYWVIPKQVTDLAQMKGLFKVLVLVHLLLGAMTPEMFTDPETRHYIKGGTFLGDGNDYALSLTIAIPLCLFLLIEARRIYAKAWHACVLALLLFCVVATQSRGGTMALAATAIYYWLKSDKKAVIGAIGAVAVVAILAMAPANYFDRMNTVSSYQTDGSAQGRIHAWEAGARMALYNPLGVGAGNFPANYIRYTLAKDETRWKTAHSIYFLILGELGILGLLSLLALILHNLVANRIVLKQIVPTSPNAASDAGLLACLSASMLAFATAGAFLSATYYPHMYVIAGLSVAARRLVRAHIEAKPVAPPNPKALTVAHRALGPAGAMRYAS
jgi:putative inorganic carbon (HCO3(-)) transporter